MVIVLLWSYGPISGRQKGKFGEDYKKGGDDDDEDDEDAAGKKKKAQCHSMSTSRSTTARTKSPMAAMVASDSAAMLPLQRCWWARSMIGSPVFLCRTMEK